jgi:hypothetical protein
VICHIDSVHTIPVPAVEACPEVKMLVRYTILFRPTFISSLGLSHHCLKLFICLVFSLVHHHKVEMAKKILLSVPHKQSIGVNMAADAAHPLATVHHRGRQYTVSLYILLLFVWSL